MVESAFSWRHNLNSVFDQIFGVLIKMVTQPFIPLWEERDASHLKKKKKKTENFLLLPTYFHLLHFAHQASLLAKTEEIHTGEEKNIDGRVFTALQERVSCYFRLDYILHLATTRLVPALQNLCCLLSDIVSLLSLRPRGCLKPQLDGW